MKSGNKSLSSLKQMKFFCLLFLAGAILFSLVFAGSADAITIINPLKYDTVQELISAIIKLLMELAIWIFPIVIIIAGFGFITAGGDENKIKTSKQIITWAVIGLIIVLSAWAIVALFEHIMGTGPEDQRVKTTLENIRDWLFYLLTIIAGIAFIIAGYNFATAAGDAEKIRKAQSFVLYGIIGVVVAVSAQGLVSLVCRIAGLTWQCVVPTP